MLDSVYHVTLKYFIVKTSNVAKYRRRCYELHLKTLSKYSWFIDFITWCYITPLISLFTEGENITFVMHKHNFDRTTVITLSV